MRISRRATNALLGALVAGSSAAIGVATGVTSAAAAPYSCASINGLTVVKTNSVAGSVDYSANVNFVAGDTLTATWSSISGTSTGSSLQVPTSRQVYVGASSETMFYTVTAVDIGAGYWTPEFKTVLSGTVTSATITITCRNSSTIAEEVVSAVPAGPEDVLQQVGKPTGGCDSLQDPQLNWSGVSAGGWGDSWAQWVNGGLGGAVCTRTLTYVAGGWRVAS